VKADGLEEVLPVQEINEKTLGAFKKDGGSDNAKIVNLARSLAASVRKKQDEQPHLIPLGDRAERVLALFEDRQLGTKDALKELQKAVEEFNAAQKELKERGFDPNTFSIYWVLHRSEVDDADGLATAINEAFEKFPNSQVNADERRELKAEVYKLLLPKVKKQKRHDLADQILRLRRR
jgi:type I restriction enzyme R subunit